MGQKRKYQKERYDQRNENLSFLIYINGNQYNKIMNKYIQEIKEQAYLMIKKYGKEQSEKDAISIAESYQNDINNIQYYDSEKINLWENQRNFWFDVAKNIREFNNE